MERVFVFVKKLSFVCNRVRRRDSCSFTGWQYYYVGFSPCLSKYLDLRNSPTDSSFDSLSFGMPPKSPDHSDMNILSISIQTHRETCSPKTSVDVWHSRHPPETSEGGCRLLTGLILIEINCLTPRASSAKRSRERVLSRLSLGRHDFCRSRHRAGAPHTYSYSTCFPGQSDESTQRRPGDGPRPSPGLREVAAHRCDKKGSRRYVCAKRDPECKKGATSPSGNRTYVKSATSKSIGCLDLQSFHEIRVDLVAVFRKPLLAS